MRIMAAFLAVLLILVSSQGQARPSGYEAAAKAFQNLPLQQRVNLQLLLTVAGYWSYFPTANYGRSTFDSISHFQKDNGFPATGYLTNEQVRQLNRVTKPTLDYWRLTPFEFSKARYSLWFPRGLDLESKDAKSAAVVGFSTSNATRPFLSLFYADDGQSTLEEAKKDVVRRATERGYRILSNVSKNGAFIVVSEKIIDNIPLRHYVFFKKKKIGIAGFYLYYDMSDTKLHGERLEVLLASSLWQATTPGYSPLAVPAPLLNTDDMNPEEGTIGAPGKTTPQKSAQPGYDAAAKLFEAQPLAQRLNQQMLLVTAGFLPAVPAGSFTQDVFGAISSFQSANGFRATGILKDDQIDQLNRSALPILARWGLREIAHPKKPYSIWVPMGLGLVANPTDSGLRFSDPKEDLVVNFISVSGSTLSKYYNTLVKLASSAGAKIIFKELNKDAFIISVTFDGHDVFFAYFFDGKNIIGYNLRYKETDESHPQRLMSILYEGLSSQLPPASTKTAMPHAEAVPGQQAQATSGGSEQNRSQVPDAARDPDASPSSPSEASTTRAPPDAPDSDKPTGSSGTGIVVTEKGDVLTNAHVVEGCKYVRIEEAGGASPVNVVARDKTNDLALVRAPSRRAKVAQFRSSIRLGESVAAFGFPLSGLLASSGNFTLGNVTATAGMGDDSRYLQISAPVQPGNSGGPLLDGSGNVVGVVSAKLDAIEVMKESKSTDIAQNVNFAIKSSVAMTFLEGNDVKVATAPLGVILQPADLADLAKSFTVYLTCRY